MHRGSGVEIFIFVDTLTQFGYLYVKVGPASEPETCALIGYPRVKNVFSFDSHFDSPQNNKGLNKSIEYRDPLHRNSARRKPIQYRIL